MKNSFSKRPKPAEMESTVGVLTAAFDRGAEVANSVLAVVMETAGNGFSIIS
jgi:hypothetical protein